MDTEARLKQLRADLMLLQRQLADETRAKFNRINPFVEDLTDWKERGAYWLGEDKNVTVYNSTTIVGDVTIGENTWVGPYCSLDGTAGLSIGKNCSISLGCQILTHDTAKWALSAGKMPYEYGPSKIGDNCFLGSYVVVLKGVAIGKHCLIGAGAVVTHDVPDFSVVLGVPGKVAGRVNLDLQGHVTIEIF